MHVSVIVERNYTNHTQTHQGKRNSWHPRRPTSSQNKHQHFMMKKLISRPGSCVEREEGDFRRAWWPGWGLNFPEISNWVGVIMAAWASLNVYGPYRITQITHLGIFYPPVETLTPRPPFLNHPVRWRRGKALLMPSDGKQSKVVSC